MSINVLVIVISCKKNEHLWKKIIDRGIDNMIILCGGADETQLKEKILYLKCNDNYEGLSEKIMLGFDYILHCDTYKSFTHFLKADDHDTDFTLSKINEIPIKYEKILSKCDYIGQNVFPVFNGAQQTYHFGKVSKDSTWNNKVFTIKNVPFCGGGETYILSRKSLKYLNINLHEHTNFGSYEDQMMAYILFKYNIHPLKVDYGIKTWIG